MKFLILSCVVGSLCLAGCAHHDHAAHARSQSAWLEATGGTFAGGPCDDD
jgi:outer membrane murein-binding lipoprotein Lpp